MLFDYLITKLNEKKLFLLEKLLVKLINNKKTTRSKLRLKNPHAEQMDELRRIVLSINKSNINML